MLEEDIAREQRHAKSLQAESDLARETMHGVERIRDRERQLVQEIQSMHQVLGTWQHEPGFGHDESTDGRIDTVQSNASAASPR